MSEQKMKYKTHVKLTLTEFNELNKANNTYIKNILIIDAFFIIISLFNLNNSISFINFVISLIISLIIINIILYLFYPSTIKRAYKKMITDKTNDIEYDIYFYETYLEKISEYYNIRTNYEDILNIIETNNNIFIKISSRKFICVIKNNCNDELLVFLKNIKKNNYKNIQQNLQLETSNFTTKLMNILFYLSLISLPCAFLLSQFVAKINNIPIEISSSTMWIFWTLIPIPAISVFLSFIYKDNQRNAIIGLIVIFILFGFGSLSKATEKIAYSQIENYNSIINFEIPVDSKCYQLNHCNTINTISVSSEKYIILNDNIDDKYLMDNKDKWLKGNDVKKIKESLPGSDYINIDKDSYCLLYDTASKEYNHIYDDNEKHNLIFIKYTPEKLNIKITEYSYCYDCEETSTS